MRWRTTMNRKSHRRRAHTAFYFLVSSIQYRDLVQQIMKKKWIKWNNVQSYVCTIAEQYFHFQHASIWYSRFNFQHTQYSLFFLVNLNSNRESRVVGHFLLAPVPVKPAQVVVPIPITKTCHTHTENTKKTECYECIVLWFLFSMNISLSLSLLPLFPILI